MRGLLLPMVRIRKRSWPDIPALTCTSTQNGTATTTTTSRWTGGSCSFLRRQKQVFLPCRVFSTSPFSDEESLKGAWTLLSALEKAKEAQGVKLAQLINGLETLLPRDKLDNYLVSQQQGQQHVIAPIRSMDPAFFSLPSEKSVGQNLDLNASHVIELLQATRQGRRISLETCEAIIQEAIQQFRQAPVIVELPPLLDNQRMTIVGDLHGSLSDLEAVLGLTGEPSAKNRLLFNGDLADRGDHGLEVIVIVCALVLVYPDCVFINRGNHEDLALSFAYGLSKEVKHKYGPGSFRKRLGPQLDDLFRALPVATVVENDALIVHAGPPPPGIRLKDIPRIIQPNRRGLSRTIRTYQEVDPDHLRAHEVLEALVWSDPAIIDDESHHYYFLTKKEEEEATIEGWIPNFARGAGFKYNAKVVRDFLQSEGLFRLIRSHEPVQMGCLRYDIAPPQTSQKQGVIISARHKKQSMELFTVFSASRYPHKEGFNQGAVLVLQARGKHTIIRYATEEDEPRVSSAVTTFDEQIMPSNRMCNVDTESLRRALQQVVIAYRSELTYALERLQEHYNTVQIPFESVVDVLIQTLRIDESDLETPAARSALARALSKPCPNGELPKTMDVMSCLDNLIREGEGETSLEEALETPTFLNPWLRAIFEMVDANRDGVISEDEWMQAVNTMNAKLPPGKAPILAGEFWKVLDVNGNGYISSTEWHQLVKAMGR